MSIKSLESTFIYSHLNRSNGLTQNISGLLTQGITLTKNNLEEAFMIINKNFKFPLKYRVMSAYDNGEILLKFSEKSKLPTCLPFFLTKTDRGIVSVVSVDIYGSMDDETGNVKIDPKKLYCMMEAAYLAKICYLNSKQLASRAAVISHGSNIYSSMFVRVLNKKYALNIDKSKYHKVVMLASKFFMINLLGMEDNDTTFNYAIKNCPNGNLYTLQEINDAFDSKAYATFDAFIQELAKPSLGLNFKDLTVRNYLEAFINMFDTSALLALESFPYFLYNVISVTNGAYINNQYILENIVDIHGAKIYADLLNLDRY